MFTLCRCALLVLVAVASGSHALSQDHGAFRPDQNAFYDTLKAESARLAEVPEETAKVFKMDLSTVQAPASIGDFTTVWHTPPISQGISGMCWCFSTTSFFESELHRLHGRSIKLSEPFTVYWEYVEKARRFVRERGDSFFGEGSEANAVPRIWKKYGIVPLEAYPGKPAGRRFYDHAAMVAEIKKYLAAVGEAGAWNEEIVLGTVRAILDHHMGPPPSTITVERRSMSPQEFFEEIVALDMDDYVNILSLMEQPSWAFVEYTVQDNWWKSREYINVPLDVFMDVIREAVRRGYSLVLGGDTSEPGYDGHVGIAVVPSFDIPPEQIDENARQLRFSNKTTGDEHGVHLVGHTMKDGQHWYLIKDSGSGARNNSHPGYFFYREDYIKLKMVDLMVHRDVVPERLARVRR